MYFMNFFILIFSRIFHEIHFFHKEPVFRKRARLHLRLRRHHRHRLHDLPRHDLRRRDSKAQRAQGVPPHLERTGVADPPDREQPVVVVLRGHRAGLIRDRPGVNLIKLFFFGFDDKLDRFPKKFYVAYKEARAFVP